MSGRTKTFASGEEVVIALRFEYEGGEEIETVEAVFVREGSDEEITLLGDANREAAGGRAARYAAQLGGRIGPGAVPGEYRCARLSARDQFDDDRDFADAAKLDLVIRVERASSRPEVTASEFL